MTGFLFLAAGILFLLSMASFHPRDPSWDTAAGVVRTNNLIGPAGAHLADLFLQSFGLAAFLFPLLIFALGWKWIRSEALEAPADQTARQRRACGFGLRRRGAVAGLAGLRPHHPARRHGGIPGRRFAETRAESCGNRRCAATSLVVSTYLVSTFTLAKLDGWLSPFLAVFTRIRENWRRSMERRREEALQKMEDRRQAAEARRSNSSGSNMKTARATLPACPTPPSTQRTRRREPEPVPKPCRGTTAEPARKALLKLRPSVDAMKFRSASLPKRLRRRPRIWSNFLSAQPVKRDPCPKHQTIYRLPSTDC